MKQSQTLSFLLAAAVAVGGFAFSLSASAMSPGELQDLVVEMHNNHVKLHEAMKRGEIKKEDVMAQKRAAYQAGRITLPETTHPKLKDLESRLAEGSLSKEAFRKELREAKKSGDIPKEDMMPFMQKLMLSGKLEPGDMGHGNNRKSHGKSGKHKGKGAGPEGEAGPGEL